MTPDPNPQHTASLLPWPHKPLISIDQNRGDRDVRRKELEDKYKQKRASYIEKYRNGGQQQTGQGGAPRLQLNEGEEEGYLEV